MAEVGKKRDLPDDKLPSEVLSGDDDTTVFMPAIDPHALQGLTEDQDLAEEAETVAFQAVDPNVFKKELSEEELEQIVNEVGKNNPLAMNDCLPSEVGPGDEEDMKEDEQS